MLLKFTQYLVLFFYIYSIQLLGLPFGVGTRILLASLGIGMFFFNMYKKVTFNKKFILFGFLLIFLSIISVISVVFNISNDYYFVSYSLSLILILFAAYFTVNFFLINNEVNQTNYIKILSESIIYVIFFQSILAFVMFFIPELSAFLNSIQVFSELDEGKLDELLDVRVIGFGIKFFSFGLVNGFALILTTSLLKRESYTPSKRIMFWLIYFSIFIIGMMAARTTVIGFVLSLLLYLNPFQSSVKKSGKDKWKLIVYTLLISFCVFILSKFLLSDYEDKIFTLTDFAFDLFINYFETGDAQSESLNQMSEMYKWPTELKTYLIGDGRFMGTGYEFYYKNTDIGWVRLLYYFGVPGTIIYILTHYYVLKWSANKFSKYKYTFLVLFLYFILLNFKGFTDIIYLIIPFLFSLNKHNFNLKNEGFSK